MAASASGNQGASANAARKGPARAWRSCARSRRQATPAPSGRVASVAAGAASPCSKRASVRASRLARTISKAPMAASANAVTRVSSTRVSTWPLPSTRS